MLLGGNNENGVSKSVEIKDLSSETNNLQLKHGGKCYFSPMLDEKGALHCFFGYGDSQLLHETLDVKDQLRPPILQTQKKIIKHTPAPQPSTRISQPQSRAQLRETVNSHSQPRMKLSKENLDFHSYHPPIESSSPMFSSEFNFSPNIYPERKNKIRNIRAHINQSSSNLNKDLQYESFFHRRNSPQNRKTFLPPKMPNTLTRTEPELGRKLGSGLPSVYASSRQGEEFYYGTGHKSSYNF